jgi:hypothetical protein
MKNTQIKNSFIAGALGCLLMPVVHASTPVWTYSAPIPASALVSSSGTATVQYTVTNQSSKPKNLKLKVTAGLSASSCYLAGKGSTCTLTVTVNGSQIPKQGIHSGPILCEQGNANQCYQPSQANRLSVTVSQNTGAAILNASVTDLALKVSGNSRSITITNTGDGPATGLSINQPGWPSGTSLSPSSTCANGGSLAVGASCTLVIAPGATATSNCTTGIAPTPGVLTVSANGGASASVNTTVIGYGCQYQGGFVFAMDDTTPTTGSIGGKVASLVDQAAPYISSGPQPTSIIWGSNGAGFVSADVSYDVIPGIDETSTSSAGSPTYTTPAGPSGYTFTDFFTTTYPSNSVLPLSSAFSTCDGSTDGACNTNNILAFYNAWITNYSNTCDPNQGGSGGCTATSGATLSTDYAAGLCKATINGYSDWYLPAICELDAVYGNVTTCSGAQSMVANLSFLIGDLGAGTPSTSCNQPDGPPAGTDCLAGGYWSSTEYANGPQDGAWVENFVVGGSGQYFGNKDDQFGVRCVRGF